MIVTTPASATPPKLPTTPTAPAPHDAPTAPAGHDAPSAPGAPTGHDTPADPTAPKVPVPADAPPTGPADAKTAVIDRLMKTSAGEAMAEVDGNLAKLSALTVGGPGPEGAKDAAAATALLTDSSMLLQHAHVKAMEDLHQLAGDLHVRLMSSASGLAFIGGQVAAAGQSKTPVKVAEVAAGQIAETEEAMHDVAAVLSALNAPAAPKPDAGEVVNQTHAPNGNGGFAPPITAGQVEAAAKAGEVINQTHSPNGNGGFAPPITAGQLEAAAKDAEVVNQTHSPNGNGGFAPPITAGQVKAGRMKAPAPSPAASPMKAAIEQLASDIREGNVRMPPPGVM
ncbi:MAG: hypothetical protein JWM98_2522 [Thermoleophilia bacterium]|nr:hypothetical protein [Thermoleophilia bacterium]